MPSLARFKGGVPRDELTGAELGQLLATDPAAQQAVMGASMSLQSGVWAAVPSFCQVTLIGNGAYSYDLKDPSGVITLNVDSGNSPTSGPLYVGNNQVRFNFGAAVSAKVN